MIRFSYAAAALAALLSFGLGCGLVDSNIADFDLSLPDKEVTVDTADWMLTDQATVPAIDCTDQASVCSSAVSQFCAAGEICTGSCDGTNCRAEVLVALFQRFELDREKPELADIDDQPLVKVTIGRIGYFVTENTMNVDSPPLTVHVGPQEAMTANHPQAELIGNIPSIPAGMTVESAEVELDPEAKERLSAYMRDYRTPFNLIVGGRVDLSAGDTVPSGRVVATIQVNATAGL